MAENRFNDNGAFTFEIVESLGALDEPSENGWTRELNRVSWNGGKPKLNIREWSPDHTHMSRGITLTDAQCLKLARLIAERARDIQRQSPVRDNFER